MIELRCAFTRWIDAWWRRVTHHDLGEGLSYDCHLANRDLFEALFGRKERE